MYARTVPLRVSRVTSDLGDTAIGVRLNVNGLWGARFGLEQDGQTARASIRYVPR